VFGFTDEMFKFTIVFSLTKWLRGSTWVCVVLSASSVHNIVRKCERKNYFWNTGPNIELVTTYKQWIREPLKFPYQISLIFVQCRPKIFVVFLQHEKQEILAKEFMVFCKGRNATIFVHSLFFPVEGNVRSLWFSARGEMQTLNFLFTSRR